MPAFDTYFENYEHEQWLREKELEEYREKLKILKPCKICGGKAEIVEKKTEFIYTFYSYYVECTKCGNKTDTRSFDYMAAVDWNKQ